MAYNTKEKQKEYNKQYRAKNLERLKEKDRKNYRTFHNKKAKLKLKYNLIFPMRKKRDKVKELIYNKIRPTGNRLEGYSPSCLLNHVKQSEEEEET